MREQQATVIAEGRLVDQPQVKERKNGSVIVTDFSLAVNSAATGVTFIGMAAFGKELATVLQACAKGDSIIAYGSLRQSRWSDDSGVKHSRHSVVVTHVALLPKSAKKDETGKEQAFSQLEIE